MELKNALAVCLITFCSATIVVLIARALDIQAARRLEPRLDRIIEELVSLRNAESARPTAIEAARQAASGPTNGLTVYYFHSSTRCPTCESIESQTRAVVQSDFRPYLESGQLHWEVLNYESPAASDLCENSRSRFPWSSWHVERVERRPSGSDSIRCGHSLTMNLPSRVFFAMRFSKCSRRKTPNCRHPRRQGKLIPGPDPHLRWPKSRFPTRS